MSSGGSPSILGPSSPASPSEDAARGGGLPSNTALIRSSALFREILQTVMKAPREYKMSCSREFRGRSLTSHSTERVFRASCAKSGRYWYVPVTRPIAMAARRFSGRTAKSPGSIRSRKAQSWPTQFAIFDRLASGNVSRQSPSNSSRVWIRDKSPNSGQPITTTLLSRAMSSLSPSPPARTSQTAIVLPTSSAPCYRPRVIGQASRHERHTDALRRRLHIGVLGGQRQAFAHRQFKVGGVVRA